MDQISSGLRLAAPRMYPGKILDLWQAEMTKSKLLLSNLVPKLSTLLAMQQSAPTYAITKTMLDTRVNAPLVWPWTWIIPRVFPRVLMTLLCFTVERVIVFQRLGFVMELQIVKILQMN